VNQITLDTVVEIFGRKKSGFANVFGKFDHK